MREGGSRKPKRTPASMDLSNRQAIAELYRAEAPGLARYFRRRFRSEGDALDWVHETFVRFAQAIPDASVRNPKAYLQRIARNLIVDGWRKSIAVAVQFVELDRANPSVGPDQDHAIEASDLMQQYRRALATLTPKTRVVFLLHRVEELTYNEIAARLEISINTVEYHMARALSHLDRALDRD